MIESIPLTSVFNDGTMACIAISSIEINPLVAYEYGQGVKAVDVRILLSTQEAGI